MINQHLKHLSSTLYHTNPQPMLPRHSKSRNTGKPSKSTGKGWIGLRLKDLADLSKKLREKFQWTHTPREFQLEAIKAQLLRKDILVHAGTGSGKTTIAAGPHAFVDPSKGMVTFMVSPLIALQEEQVS
jgi:superfamily II DNA helicase RecQ